MLPESEQEKVLETFRRELFEEGILQEGDSIGTDDGTLLRFLRARKFDLRESKKMIKTCQHWRKTVSGIGIDELYKQIDPFDYPGREEVFKSWSMYFHKTDKKGRPLNIQFFGGLNLPELYKHITPEKHWEAIVVNADSLPREILPAASHAAGRPIETSFVVVDLKGFGLSQFWQVKSLARDSFQISQDYFPETMGKLAIVNAPSSFTFIWSMIKPWLSKETVDKVEVLGSDYQKVLLDLVDAENLPETLGGKCRCEHEGGCDFSGAGPWMDQRKRKLEEETKVNSESLVNGDMKVEENGLSTPSELSPHASVTSDNTKHEPIIVDNVDGKAIVDSTLVASEVLV